ncbi:MFS transporter [Cellvibrio zantedeschiae]|uniref:MFS transporter n=1 Tax=Cellvibrio zantedeschiae TaxID=1237077 RepID=A0ABQ3B5I3_9GAMM|nr:MFS transporter [Cellvibrio zantedeschiae]GGY80155.1 MFS transporter [Cellvibrio zantedeschiae]
MLSNSVTTQPATKRGIISWMFYDWAAQPFFTVVLTFIFGPYFASRLIDDPTAGQAAWGYTVTISGIVIALLSPVMGAIADASGSRKKWIGFFAFIKISALALLWFAAPGSALWLPMACIIFATIAAEFSIVFNDSMMPRLVNKTEVGRLSNSAWGLGYLGGLVALFIVLLLLAGSPATGKTLIGLTPLFGLDPTAGEDARITGPLAACWYFIFIIPMFLFTPDTSTGLPLGVAVKTGLRELKNTLVELKHRTAILKFLAARMLYQDGVNGLLALGGTFAAGMFGWKTVEMGVYGILLLFAAIFGCYFAGKIDVRLGSKKVVSASLVGLIIATLGIVSTGPGYTLFGLLQLSTTDTGGLFGTAAEKAYILFGLLIGLVFGPVQASSRSYLARSVNVDEAGRYFGLYAFAGRATSFFAPLSVATITVLTNSARIGMCALIVFLVVGFLLLLIAPYPAVDNRAKPSVE